ncbi:low-affinity Cu transporter [Hanseniaspora uvarum]|nr:low-affinity Cu transporter [Hanseniaspora uvarum]
MDHSMHDMPGMGDADEMCSMAMLFTWSYKNTCVISSKWHIKTKFQMFLSCVLIFLSSYFYEYFKVKFNQYKLQKSISAESEENKRKSRQYESLLYGLQVFYSFMLMLVFMTYNGWLMLAMTLGAIFGYYKFTFNVSSLSSSLACH